MHYTMCKCRTHLCHLDPWIDYSLSLVNKTRPRPRRVLYPDHILQVLIPAELTLTVGVKESGQPGYLDLVPKNQAMGAENIYSLT